MKKIAILCLMAASAIGLAEGFTLDANTSYKATINNEIKHSMPSKISLDYSLNGVNWNFAVENPINIPGFKASDTKVNSEFSYTTPDVIQNLSFKLGGSLNVRPDGDFKPYFEFKYKALPSLVFSGKTKYESVYLVDPKYVGQELALEGLFKDGSVKGTFELGHSFKNNIKSIIGVSGKYNYSILTYSPFAKVTVDHTFKTGTSVVVEGSPIKLSVKPGYGLTINLEDNLYSNLSVVANKLIIGGQHSFNADKLNIKSELKFTFNTEAVVNNDGNTKYVKIDKNKTKNEVDVAFQFIGDASVSVDYKVLPQLKLYGQVGISAKHNMFLKSNVLTQAFQNVTPSVKVGLSYNF